MRVLVLEGDPGSAASTIDELGAAGHSVVQCHEPDAPAFPCTPLIDEGSCPLTTGAVDVAVAVRDESDQTGELHGGEAGVTCALRRFVPVVAVGHNDRSPLAQLATEVVEQPGATDAAVRQAQAAPLRAHERVARDAFRHVLEHHGFTDIRAGARVTRRGNTVRVEFCPSTPVPKAVAEIACVRAVAAIRAIDSETTVINVVVEPALDPASQDQRPPDK